MDSQGSVKLFIEMGVGCRVHEVHGMEIRRFSLISGAREATGLAVIIDVLRAFTTDAYVMANGAVGIYPVATVEEALDLRKLHPDWLLIGERGGIKVEGFDFGNSPDEVMGVDFSGRTVIQTTGAGTQGIVNAGDADEVVLGSFVMAEAIVDFIRRREPEVVSLVAMGWNGREPTLEDELCAEYLEGRLEGRTPDFHGMRSRIRETAQGAKFFDPAQPQYHEGDFYAAMDLDRFPFVLVVDEVDGLSVVKKAFLRLR